MEHESAQKGFSSLVNKEDLDWDKAMKEFADNIPLAHDEKDDDEGDDSFSLLLKVADLVEDKFAGVKSVEEAERIVDAGEDAEPVNKLYGCVKYLYISVFCI